MKPFTCIIHDPEHINPVQWFHTRAETPEQAEGNALNWFFSGEPKYEEAEERDKVHVPFVFEGWINPVNK